MKDLNGLNGVGIRDVELMGTNNLLIYLCAMTGELKVVWRGWTYWKRERGYTCVTIVKCNRVT